MGRGKGYGTGSPITFLCAVGRKEDWRTNQRHYDHKVKVTGRERPYHSARGSARGARSDSIAREYICSCGHKGWSAHIDLKGYPMTAGTWNEADWGSKEEHGIDERTKLEGWNVGDDIKMLQDEGDEGPYSGEEGTIVGIRKRKATMFDPTERDELVVDFDDYEELMYVSPYSVGETFDDEFGDD